MTIFTKDLDSLDDDVMTVEKWISCCEGGGFIDYDGYGYPMKDGKKSTTPIRPSQRNQLPEGTTHISWYNR